MHVFAGNVVAPFSQRFEGLFFGVVPPQNAVKNNLFRLISDANVKGVGPHCLVGVHAGHHLKAAKFAPVAPPYGAGPDAPDRHAVHPFSVPHPDLVDGREASGEGVAKKVEGVPAAQREEVPDLVRAGAEMLVPDLRRILVAPEADAEWGRGAGVHVQDIDKEGEETFRELLSYTCANEVRVAR